MASGRGCDIPARCFNFGVRIIRLCARLNQVSIVGRQLSGQLLSAGTSVGANVEEGQAGQSRADFITKYRIALKEARESDYRLRLLIASGILNDQEVIDLQREAVEISLILGRSLVTARRNSDMTKGSM
jgi:four helix bundle protein